MNCKPDQLAWIVVPQEQGKRGVEQLNGHVVRTVRLRPAGGLPVWVVTPQQWVTIQQPCRDANGEVLRPGDRVFADGIPDAWLRPFDPLSAPAASISQLELLA